VSNITCLTDVISHQRRAASSLAENIPTKYPVRGILHQVN
jgi:hypothetical protein